MPVAFGVWQLHKYKQRNPVCSVNRFPANRPPHTRNGLAFFFFFRRLHLHNSLKLK